MSEKICLDYVRPAWAKMGYVKLAHIKFPTLICVLCRIPHLLCLHYTTNLLCSQYSKMCHSPSHPWCATCGVHSTSVSRATYAVLQAYMWGTQYPVID